MLLKQKSPSLCRNLALGTFGKFPIAFSTKVILTIQWHRFSKIVCENNFSKSSNLHVTLNLNLHQDYGCDCIPVVVLKNCEPELLYILAETFNMCLKETCFPDCWKVSSVVPVLRMFEKGLLLKTTTLLVFFLWSVKSLRNL